MKIVNGIAISTHDIETFCTYNFKEWFAYVESGYKICARTASS